MIFVTPVLVTGIRFRHSRKKIPGTVAGYDGFPWLIPNGRPQIPSFAFNRSLTACGFALPPVDFIT